MIRFGVLGTARVVPYGLLAPAKETPGVEVSGIASRTPQKADEFAPMRRFWNLRMSMQYISRFRRRFTMTGRVGQSKQANMYSAKSRLRGMRS
jgi:hypothetical protein